MNFGINNRTPLIKSIQYGTISVAGGSASNTATITSVDVNNAFVVFLGQDLLDTTNAGLPISALRVDLTNATTVTATRISTATGAGPVSFMVIEFHPGYLKSIQAGTIAMGVGDTSKTATITSVDTTKTMVFRLGFTTNDGSGTNDVYSTKLTLTNATTITASRQTSGFAATVGYVAVEGY